MHNSSEKNNQSLIESAMSRLPPNGATEAPATARERNSIGRRDYDLTLAKRLEQLRNAMGEEELPAPSPAPSTAPTNSPDMATALMTNPTTGFSTAALTTTAIASALAGAGLTWLILSNSPPSPFLPPAPIVSLPAVIPALTPRPISPPALPAEVTPKEEVAVAPPPPPPAAKPAEEVAAELLEGWRMAWSNRDVDAYLAYYSPDFVSSKGQTHEKWADDRRKNLSSRKEISVTIHGLQFEQLADDKLKMSFLQDYASGNYSEKAQPKTLLLTRQGDNWLIIEEQQGR